MTDHSDMPLGKQPPKIDPRTFQFAKYATGDLPEAPVACTWTFRVLHPWGMLGNDKIGDCTCATAGHLVHEWLANDGVEAVVPDADVIAAYSAVTGYDPATGANDNGAVELDVLNYWRKSGIGGHQLLAYAAVEPSNKEHVKLGVQLFGGVYIGLAMPLSAQTQDVWAVPPGGVDDSPDGAPGSWGGHAVPIVSYDRLGLTCVTWGELKRMTWQFWNTYCDEAYILLGYDWVGMDKKAPSGIDLEALQADLEALK